MKESDSEFAALTPQESWQAIHTTMDKARNSMYVAGTATILLLWGVISALGFTAQYVFETLAPDFALPNPWLYPLLWGILIACGDGGQRPHWTPRGQAERGGRRHAQRRHPGFPLLACGSGSGVLRPWCGRHVDLQTLQPTFPAFRSA